MTQTFTPTHTNTHCYLWTMYPVLKVCFIHIFFACMSLHTTSFQALCWWLPCVVCRRWELPFPWKEKGNATQCHPPKCFLHKSRHRKRNGKPLGGTRSCVLFCMGYPGAKHSAAAESVCASVMSLNTALIKTVPLFLLGCRFWTLSDNVTSNEQ